MAPWHDPTREPSTDALVTTEVRRLVHRATAARLRGQHAVADDLFREAQALDAAFTQYQAALIDARRQVSELTGEVQTFWARVADDRTLHDLADDACVLLALHDDLARARDRLITLELTRP